MSRIRISALLLGLSVTFWPLFVTPAELLFVEVDKMDGRYHIVSEIWFAAEIDGVFRVLTDYDHFDTISSIFKESGYLRRNDDGSGLVYTVAKGCLVFYCTSIRRTERLEVTPATRIVATAIPDESDMKYSRAVWELRRDRGGTHMRYTIEMEPDFWVPPILGSVVMKWALKRGGERAATRIEAAALENPVEPALSEDL